MKAFLDANLLIYLNTITSDELRRPYENFYLNVITQYKAFTDPIVVDEVLYVSKKKYGVPYSTTKEFLESIVFPYVEVLPIGEEEVEECLQLLLKYSIKPSDALHVAVMKRNNIGIVVSEDTEFDKLEGEVERLWLTASSS